MPEPRSAPVGRTGREAPVQPGASGSTRMLALATVGFLVSFWAWALISPLGSAYREELGLSPIQQALLVAVPVIVGSIGRVPVGALTDRLGARRMFPMITALTIIPVLYLGLFGDSYEEIIVGGFFLGLGGTTFAVGVPLVSAWFAPERRGLALGVFGIGMGGTAVSAFSTVRLADAFGRAAPFVLVAVVLGLYTVASAVLLRDPPGCVAPGGSFLARTWSTARLPATIQCASLYAVGFGGFVAFSVYLPVYLVNAYGLAQEDAALRTAGFVVLAVVMRPTGGWLSDRTSPASVLTVSFAAAGALAALAAFELPLIPLGTVAFLGLAAALGASSGACFALVAQVAPAGRVGGVTGVVGAAGGLGGFVPPLVMGAIYGRVGDYSLGLALLSAVAFGCAAFTWFALRSSPERRRVEAAL